MKTPARIEIRLGGTGGQGLILSGKMLASALASLGKRVAQSQTYATALDCLVLLDTMAIKPSWPLLKPGALVIADTRLCPELPQGDYRAYPLPLSRTAIELGSERVANIVALGVLVNLAKLCENKVIEQAVRTETPMSFLDLNMDALAAGYKLAAQAVAASPAVA